MNKYSKVSSPHFSFIIHVLTLVILFISFVSCSRPLPDVGIRHCTQNVQKELFHDLKNEGVYSITQSKFNHDHKNIIIINSFTYACENKKSTSYLKFFSLDGSLISSTNLSNMGGVDGPVDMNKNGIHNFYASESNGMVIFLDDQGNTLWSFLPLDKPLDKNNRHMSTIKTGDVDGDGKKELVVAATDGKDYFIYVLDKNKAIKSQFIIKDCYFRFSFMKIIDVDGDGRDEIVYLGSNDNVTIINAKGEHIREFKAPWDERCLNIWPKSDKPLLYGTTRKANELVLADTFGNVVSRQPIDPLERIDKIFPVYFQGSKGKNHYVAIRFWAYTYDRSALYILDSKGKIVYEEILPERVHNIEVIHNPKNKKDYVLFSASNKLWSLYLK